MTVIAVLAAKGSPGATTVSAALAAAATCRSIDALLVELDPAGGSLALDTQLPLDPGMTSLLAAARRGLDPALVEAHSQRLANGVSVLFGPTRLDRARTVTTALTDSLIAAVRSLPGLTIVDLGRWDDDEATIPMLQGADHVIVVVRPTAPGAEAARVRLDVIARHCEKPTVVCVGERPYSGQEVADALGVTAAPSIAVDERAAALVTAGASIDRWLRRSHLLRSATAILDHLGVAADLEVAS